MMTPQRDNDEKKQENTNKRQQSASPQANSNARPATKTLHRSNNKKQKQMRTRRSKDDTVTTAAAAALSSSSAAMHTTTTISTPSSKWTHTPISLLLRMIGYMDNANLIAMCLVCKQLCTIIQDGHRMEKKLVRLFELHAMERDGDASYNRIYTFIHNMQRYFGDDTKHRILTAHHKFDFGL